MSRRYILVTAMTPWAEIKCFYYFEQSASNECADFKLQNENNSDHSIRDKAFPIAALQVLKKKLWFNNSKIGTIDHCPITVMLSNLGIQRAKQDFWLSQLGNPEDFQFKTYVAKNKSDEQILFDLYNCIESIECQVKKALKKKELFSSSFGSNNLSTQKNSNLRV